MTTVIISAIRGDDLKTQIDALGATTIHIIVPLHNRPEYLVVYS